MFRHLVACALIIAVTSICVSAQDSRPTSKPTTHPTSKTTKTPDTKKWLDELATPIKVGQNGRWAEYGSAIQMKAQTSLIAIANKPENFKDKTVLLRGKINSICVKKGCWLRMEDGGKELFVKFKDYAFFAPRHLAGHDVLLEGVVSHNVVKQAERRHMAEDAGKSKDEIAAIKGDKTELRMMARSMRIIEPTAPRKAQMVLIGDHNNRKKMTQLTDVLKDPKSYVGKDIDISGQIVSAKARSFEVESSGKRLTLTFSNPLPDLRLVVMLKAATRPAYARAFGQVQMKDGAITFAVKTAAVVY